MSIKMTFFRHETDNDEIYEWFSYDDNNKFDDEKKKSYQYYEWNDDSDWFAHYKEIIKLNDSLGCFYGNALKIFYFYYILICFMNYYLLFTYAKPFLSACLKSSIKSSASSIPTLKRKNPL